MASSKEAGLSERITGLDEENNIVSVEAIIHTSEDPDGWKDRILK